MYPAIHLDPKRKKTFFQHQHPWIFSRAIAKIDSPKPEIQGEVVSVFCDGTFVMHGYFNGESQIAVRALSWEPQEKIDKEFFVRKIKSAFSTREKFLLNEDTTACRMVFAESDFLPGFIVDKYNDSYILQIHTLGAEHLKKLFVEALVEVAKPKMVFEKTQVSARRFEGMPEFHEELLFGEFVESEVIREHGILFEVNFKKGQKTGFFLDQRENRKAIQKYVSGKKVLNVFAYTGGFSIASIKGGAEFVDSIDISEEATLQATKNFTLNEIPDAVHTETCTDAFKYLSNLKAGSFDVIILDPPAFVKSQKHLNEGLKGYLSINELALKKLPENGILVTSSCSAAMDDATFFRMLNWASNAAGCKVQVLEKKSQPLDHPLTPYFPEGEYLKFYVLQKKQNGT